MFLRARNHPGLAAGLVDHLRRCGPQDEAELSSSFIPPNLARQEKTRDGNQWSGDHSFNDTVGALVESNVLVRDGRITLSEPFANHLGDAALEDRLATWLLAPELTGPDPSGADPDGHGATALLAHTLTWFMDIDPMGPWPNVTRATPEASPVHRLKDDTGRNLPSGTFDDVTDWSRFARWCIFLGFGEARPGTGGALDPDPTVAVRRVLTTTLPAETSVTTFLGALATELPSFGGHLEDSWNARSGSSADGHVKPSLANALLRLEYEGALVLDKGADESETVVFEFGRFDPVTGPEGTVGPVKSRYARIRPRGTP